MERVAQQTSPEKDEQAKPAVKKVALSKEEQEERIAQAKKKREE